MRAELGDLLGVRRCAGCGAAGALLCRGCRAALRPAPCSPVSGVDRVVAAWEYAGAARALILALKLRGRRDAALPLAAGLCEAVGEYGLEGAVLTWLPGRGRDISRRGFDHAALLARSAARRLGLPARPLLRRLVDRADQVGLGASQRAENVAGAFAAVERCSGGLVLVDDLVTTGATARVCADALREAGAPAVELLVCCRA